jgi:hypothetical protein
MRQAIHHCNRGTRPGGVATRDGCLNRLRASPFAARLGRCDRPARKSIEAVPARRYAAAAVGGSAMEQLIHLVDAVRAHPVLGVILTGAVVGVIALMRRKPKLQRDADERLAALRRDKSDQYTSLRPPH